MESKSDGEYSESSEWSAATKKGPCLEADAAEVTEEEVGPFWGGWEYLLGLGFN